MTHNIGSLDRGLRIALGLAITTLSLVWNFWPATVVGVALVGTGYFQVCLLYTALGLNTCDKEEHQAR